jgi:hypothetical protein
MRVTIAFALLATLGLANPAGAVAAGARLPSADQVAAYVRDNWPDYARRIGGEGAAITLVAVKDVVCEDRSGTPDCAFQVTVRGADGGQRELALSSSFEWTADGRLEEVIVLHHRRRTS